MLKFSILIPVYNVEKYLEQCLESVFGQIYENYEVIIVDDGSTDTSGIICDKYAEMHPERCKVIHKKNQGLISARRTAIEYAQGDYCVFVDSDDFIERDLLEKAAFYITKDYEIEVLLFSFRYLIGGEKKHRFPAAWESNREWSGIEKKEVYEKLVCTSDITSLWTKIIYTKLLKEDATNYIDYYKKNMSEDLLQSLYPITYAKKIKYVDEILYNYRINEESISRRFYPSTIEEKNTLHVYNEILTYLPLWGIDTYEIHEKLKARWFNDFMYMMCKYYESSHHKQTRLDVIRYDWEKMLPLNAYDEMNIYENAVYKKIFKWMKTKKENRIKLFFLKKKYYGMLKKWKRKLFS